MHDHYRQLNCIVVLFYCAFRKTIETATTISHKTQYIAGNLLCFIKIPQDTQQRYSVINIA